MIWFFFLICPFGFGGALLMNWNWHNLCLDASMTTVGGGERNSVPHWLLNVSTQKHYVSAQFYQLNRIVWLCLSSRREGNAGFPCAWNGGIWFIVNILSNSLFLKPEHAQINALNCHFSRNNCVWCHNT